MRLILILSALVTVFGTIMEQRPAAQAPAGEDLVLVIEEPVQVEEETQPDEQVSMQVKTGDGIVTVELEEYLAGVVMTEMLPSFHPEALKAQTAAARTFAVRMLENSKHEDCTVCASAECCQGWRSEAQLRKAMGSQYDAVFSKITEAVAATEGQVLTYDGDLIEAVYYSCSGGRSEPAKAVWGTDVPYLQSVDSPGEEQSGKFSTIVRYPFGEFCRLLEAAVPETVFAVIPEDWIGKTQYSSGGGVETMVLCGNELTGPQIRRIFSLPSTLFQLTVGNGEMVFSVRGYGHRVGMSQYGADAMARAGSTWQEILQHYYTGVSIKKLSRAESGQFEFR